MSSARLTLTGYQVMKTRLTFSRLVRLPVICLRESFNNTSADTCTHNFSDTTHPPKRKREEEEEDED